MAECVAAVIGIIQFSAQLTELSVRRYRAYQRARKELKYFCSSVSIFSQTLNFFGQSIKEPVEQGLGLAEDPQMKVLLKQISTTVEEQMGKIKQMFDRLRALGCPTASTISHLKSRVMWVIVDEREMKELLASLEPIKSTMNLLVNIMNYDLLRRKIVQPNLRSEDDIKQLESCMAQIKMLKKEVKEKQRQYEALRRVSTSDINNSFYEQAVRGQLMREIVERIYVLAANRVSASRVLMREIGREQTASTPTRDSVRSRVAHRVPIRLPPAPPLPSSSPEQNIDRSGPPPAAREAGQDINNPVEPFESPGYEARQAQADNSEVLPDRFSDISEVSQDRFTGSDAGDRNVSPIELPPSRPENVSNQNFTPEAPRAGASHDRPPPIPPSPDRYRMVVRNGKMVPKKWRQPGEKADQDDSSSSGSE